MNLKYLFHGSVPKFGATNPESLVLQVFQWLYDTRKPAVSAKCFYLKNLHLYVFNWHQWYNIMPSGALYIESLIKLFWLCKNYFLRENGIGISLLIYSHDSAVVFFNNNLFMKFLFITRLNMHEFTSDGCTSAWVWLWQPVIMKWRYNIWM